MIQQTILFLLVVLPFNLAYHADFNKSIEVIQNYVNSAKKNALSATDLCATNNCCTIGENEACSFSAMKKDVDTFVFPGGESRCIFSDSTPFAFQVIPGASDKLVLYFQGGGACWDKVSTSLGLCTTDISPQSHVGVFDRTSTSKFNRYKDYTIVHVMYCSGDVFAGDTTRNYRDSKGKFVVQKGLANVRATLDWIISKQANSELASTFTDLVVTGASAGSLGAQVWAREILSELKYKQAAVVPDSYAGVFPEGSLGPLIYDFGFCNAKFLSDELRATCNNKNLVLYDVTVNTFVSTPNVLYSFVQAKTDEVQISFYIAIAATTMGSDITITPSEFYSEVNTIFSDYKSKIANFGAYLVNGNHHVYSNQNLYYTTDGLGTTDNGVAATKEVLYAWVNRLPLKSEEKIDGVCEGEFVATNNHKKNLGNDANIYCSSSVYPHSYTQK